MRRPRPARRPGPSSTTRRPAVRPGGRCSASARAGGRPPQGPPGCRAPCRAPWPPWRRRRAIGRFSRTAGSSTAPPHRAVVVTLTAAQNLPRETPARATQSEDPRPGFSSCAAPRAHGYLVQSHQRRSRHRSPGNRPVPGQRAPHERSRVIARIVVGDPPLRAARRHPMGRDPGLRPAPRPPATGRRLLDRRVLPVRDLPLTTFQHQGTTPTSRSTRVSSSSTEDTRRGMSRGSNHSTREGTRDIRREQKAQVGRQKAPAITSATGLRRRERRFESCRGHHA